MINSTKKRWLWFLALYVISFLAVAGVTTLLRMFVQYFYS